MEEEILSGNCLSHIAINLAQFRIHKQFPSINGLEHTELGLRKWFSIRKGTDNIRVNIRPVQQQGNGVDCGSFAIVFAVTLAFGNKPKMISYDEGNLPRHLVECLKSETFSPFPSTKITKEFNEREL